MIFSKNVDSGEKTFLITLKFLITYTDTLQNNVATTAKHSAAQYMFIYMSKKPVCVCFAQWQLNEKHKVYLTNFRILLILSHVCE